jgi:hypothetical protein
MNDKLVIVDPFANYYTIGGRDATNVHNDLIGRADEDQHPMTSITSLGRYSDIRKVSGYPNLVAALSDRIMTGDMKEINTLYLDSNDTVGPM